MTIKLQVSVLGIYPKVNYAEIHAYGCSYAMLFTLDKKI